VTSKEVRGDAEFKTRHSSLVTRHFLKYSLLLKAFSIAFCLASAILIGGCADPIEKPMAQEAGEKFQRGITGNGTLGPIDRSDDPYIRERHP
jgi:hypothetical protein